MALKIIILLFLVHHWLPQWHHTSYSVQFGMEIETSPNYLCYLSGPLLLNRFGFIAVCGFLTIMFVSDEIQRYARNFANSMRNMTFSALCLGCYLLLYKYPKSASFAFLCIYFYLGSYAILAVWCIVIVGNVIAVYIQFYSWVLAQLRLRLYLIGQYIEFVLCTIHDTMMESLRLIDTPERYEDRGWYDGCEDSEDGDIFPDLVEERDCYRDPDNYGLRSYLDLSR